MKKVLFDSDVLLDVLLEREPFFKASAQSLNTVSHEQIQGYVSGHSVANIYYILRRKVGSAVALESIKILLQRIQVANVTDAVIRAALQSAITDFEDAIVSEAAKAEGVETIVTRNVSDFSQSFIRAMSPDNFLVSLSASRAVESLKSSEETNDPNLEK